MKEAPRPADQATAKKSFGSFNRAAASKRTAPAEPTFVPDAAYEASPGVGEALAAIDAGTPVVLITGRAGTGKTRLVQYAKSRPGGELQATVAPTGIAALNARAQTIHSFFHLEHAVLDAKNLVQGRQIRLALPPHRATCHRRNFHGACRYHRRHGCPAAPGARRQAPVR